MSGHAKLSPSSSSRWILCPASVSLSESVPNTSNSFAYKGTFIHQIGEELLKGEKDYLQAGTTIQVPQDNGELKTEYIPKDYFDEAKGYYDYVTQIVDRDINSELVVEMTIDLTSIAPNTYGHADAVVVENGTLHIIDLKTGSIEVSPKDNSQLMIYAYGAYEELSMYYDIDTIELHIYQNNVTTGYNVNSHTLEVKQLTDYIVHTVIPSAKEALGDNPKCVAGDIQCKWCPASSFCETLYNSVSDIFDDLTEGNQDDLISEPKTLGNVVPFKKALEFYKSLNLLTTWQKAIETRMHSELEKGEVIEGYKLVRRNKRKKWVDEIVAYDTLKKWAKLDEIAPRKLVTPPQATKILSGTGTRIKNKLEKLYVVPVGETVVAPITDKRPAIKPSVDEFDKLDEFDKMSNIVPE